MRQETLTLICDICEQDGREERPAKRLRVVDDEGQVRALDLCDSHRGYITAEVLLEAAVHYGTPLEVHANGTGRLSTVSNAYVRGSTTVIHPRSPEFHEPGGEWSGTYEGPSWCLVKVKTGHQCGRQCKNVIGVKKHQYSVHGIRVKR